jgi:hypothetical protein
VNIIIKWVRTQWDRVSAWVLVIAGALAILLGWNGVSEEPLTAQQIPYVISGGVGGLFLLGLGAMLWLSADLRDEWRRLDAIERNTRSLRSTEPDDDDPFVVPERPALNGAAAIDDMAPDPDAPPAAPARSRRKPLSAR